MNNGRGITVFTKAYLPVYQVSLKHAVILLVTGRAENLMDMAHEIHKIRMVRGYFEVADHIRMLTRETPKSFFIPKVSRSQLIKRDEGACVYCGFSNRKKLTIDHLIPQSKGGKDTWENLVIACEACNSKKGDKMLDESGLSFCRSVRLGPPEHKFIDFSRKWKYEQTD